MLVYFGGEWVGGEGALFTMLHVYLAVFLLRCTTWGSWREFHNFLTGVWIIRVQPGGSAASVVIQKALKQHPTALLLGRTKTQLKVHETEVRRI